MSTGVISFFKKLSIVIENLTMIFINIYII